MSPLHAGPGPEPELGPPPLAALIALTVSAEVVRPADPPAPLPETDEEAAR